MSTTETPQLNGEFLLDYDRLRPPQPNPNLHREVPGSPIFQCAPELSVTPEVILEESSLLPFHFLRTGDKVGRAVVKIRRGDGACGTGFLVAPDILLTNHHVLPDRATAAPAWAIANYEADSAPDAKGLRADVPLAPEKLFVTEPGLDFAFCGVSGLEHLGVIGMPRDSGTIGPKEVVNIIQHPRGRPKEVAIQDNQLIKSDRVLMQYTCDTEPGSSGSPVFDNQWKLVALHHASIVAPNGLPAQGADSRQNYLNEGIRISAIAHWLETDEAAQRFDADQIARLRALFRGGDHEVGFFGALGRWARGRSVAELVALGNLRDGTELDVGYWDLRDTARPLIEKADTLPSIIADMKLDLWTLANISPDETSDLCEILRDRYRLEYVELPREPGDDDSHRVICRNTRGLQQEHCRENGLDHLKVVMRSMSGRTVSLRVLNRSPEGIPAGSGDWLLIGDGHAHLSANALEMLRKSGTSIWIAQGSNGTVALISAGSSEVRRVFVTPSLDPSKPHGPFVGLHRSFPESVSAVTPKLPIMARVSLNEGAKE